MNKSITQNDNTYLYGEMGEKGAEGEKIKNKCLNENGQIFMHAREIAW